MLILLILPVPHLAVSPALLSPATVSSYFGAAKVMSVFVTTKTFCPFFCSFFLVPKIGADFLLKLRANLVNPILCASLSMNPVLFCGCKSNRLFLTPKTF